MKHLILAIILALLFCKAFRVNAQQYPILRFPTLWLRPSEASSVRTWFKDVASVELPHIDSLQNFYRVKDPESLISLATERVYCQFILQDWRGLAHADTAFKNLDFVPTYFRKTGVIAFSIYGDLQAGWNGDTYDAYLPALKKRLASFDDPTKQKIINTTLENMPHEAYLLKSQLEEIRADGFVTDSALALLFQRYADLQLFESVGPLLQDYAKRLLALSFSRADTIRGSVTPGRAWWDVLHYDITVKPDFVAKNISGINNMKYRVTSANHPLVMQIDLQEPMLIDNIVLDSSQKLSFTQNRNAWYVTVPEQKRSSLHTLSISYHGKVHEPVRPPWEGGWSWGKDDAGHTWTEVTCEGLGASVWYPCKDYLGDEPDSGATIHIICPDSLIGVSNGRLEARNTWTVVNPINNYDIIPYIGNYMQLSDQYAGEKGNLDLHYWVLKNHMGAATRHLIPEVQKMFQALEYWFGPYPFYEDGYKLVEAPAGMEHQGAIAYSNRYLFGSEGEDWSGTGWGLKWDYIIVHESAHEWFGNNISVKDIADMWVHEGFGCYAETLYIESFFGSAAADDYNYGLRSRIANTWPIIGYYGVNDQVSLRSSDMYYKGANLLHTIRHSLGDDQRFRSILRGMNQQFYHATVSSSDIERYFSKEAKHDYSKVFDQYLRTTQIPRLEYFFNPDRGTVTFRYSHCIKGFDLPLILKNDVTSLRIVPSERWTTIRINDPQLDLFDEQKIRKAYYIDLQMDVDQSATAN